MEQQLQQDVGTTEIQPLAKNINLGAGSFRVQDSNEGELEEKKQLLRRRLAAKVMLSFLEIPDLDAIFAACLSELAIQVFSICPSSPEALNMSHTRLRRMSDSAVIVPCRLDPYALLKIPKACSTFLMSQQLPPSLMPTPQCST